MTRCLGEPGRGFATRRCAWAPARRTMHALAGKPRPGRTESRSIGPSSREVFGGFRPNTGCPGDDRRQRMTTWMAARRILWHKLLGTGQRPREAPRSPSRQRRWFVLRGRETGWSTDRCSWPVGSAPRGTRDGRISRHPGHSGSMTVRQRYIRMSIARTRGQACTSCGAQRPRLTRRSVLRSPPPPSRRPSATAPPLLKLSSRSPRRPSRVGQRGQVPAFLDGAHYRGRVVAGVVHGRARDGCRSAGSGAGAWSVGVVRPVVVCPGPAGPRDPRCQPTVVGDDDQGGRRLWADSMRRTRSTRCGPLRFRCSHNRMSFSSPTGFTKLDGRQTPREYARRENPPRRANHAREAGFTAVRLAGVAGRQLRETRREENEPSRLCEHRETESASRRSSAPHRVRPRGATPDRRHLRRVRGTWDHVAPPGQGQSTTGRTTPTDQHPHPTLADRKPVARSTVDHTSYDTTSILRTIEERWDLPALATRDADAARPARQTSTGVGAVRLGRRDGGGATGGLTPRSARALRARSSCTLTAWRAMDIRCTSDAQS